MKSLQQKRNEAGKKSFRQRLLYAFRLQVINTDELREVFHIKVSWLKIIILGLAMVLVVSALTLFLYVHSPGQTKAVGREYEARRQMVDDALRIDSIEQVVDMQQRYLKNVQDILLGRVSADTVYSIDSLTRVRRGELMTASERERSFSQAYEEQERYSITAQTQALPGLSTLNLFRPVTGVVTMRFDTQNRHFGVDIAATPGQSILSVLDGTVMESSYTAQNGYTIIVFHSGNVVSVYKHCAMPLKEEGDRVKAGEVIGSVPLAGESDNLHLHFELWYAGQPLDPERYIALQ